MQHTWGFLGFCHLYVAGEGERVAPLFYLTHFVAGFLRYLAFMKARGCCGDYMSKTCHTAVRHLHFLKASASPPLTPTELRMLGDMLVMLDTLKWQLRKITHHKPFSYDALLDGSNWKGGAPAIIAFIEQEKEAAIVAIKVGKLHCACWPPL